MEAADVADPFSGGEILPDCGARIVCVARRGVLLVRGLLGVCRVPSAVRVLRDLPVRVSVGDCRSAAEMSDVPAAGDESGDGWTGFEDVPGMEWDGADLHGRTRAAPCAVAADELVWRAAVDVSRQLVGVFVRGFVRVLSAAQTIQAV